MPNLILVGGGGHCLSCIEVIKSIPRWSVMGIIDSPEKVGSTLNGLPVLGSDKDTAALAAKCPRMMITVGHVRSAAVRKRLFAMTREAGVVFPIIVASTAYVAESAEVGAGTIVMHRAFINAGAKVGENTILNTGCTVEHDATVGRHCHVSTGSIINGGCVVGDECLIGSGAIIRQCVRIVDHCVVGAGAVVVDDLVEPGTYVGCPARKIGKNPI
jgi:sugar O-acyltransferase (sialic acid O-acetyltransferase NeuD family)